MDFSEFSLHEDLQKGITAAGYVTCTPVQEQVLKSSLNGADLYVQSQTGTGKTAAYLVTIIQEMLTRPESADKKALIMVPTRELAVQVEEEAEKLASGTKLSVFSFYGGVGYEKQIAALKKGVNILVGTPGRVIDLQEGGQMDLHEVAFLVIDEADRMFDMGFYPDLRTLIKVLPEAEQRQTMLFSATLNSYVKNLAWEYTRDPVEITIDADNITVDEIDQELLHVSSDEKMKLLVGILQQEKPASVLVFCNTKRGCEVLAKRLQLNGFNCDFIIGDLPQSKRLKVLDDFENGKIPILVATDVAARGIDVSDLSMVVNYDLPNEAENYVHRIGRTARAGKSGKAYTFCSEQDVYNLPPIERYIEKQIPARVADPSMMAEDKSAGVYIRTENWREEGDGEGYGSHGYDHGSRTGSGSRGRRGDDRNHRSDDRRRSSDDARHGSSDRRYSRSAGRPDTQDKRRTGGRRPDGENRSPENLSKLENMSFDDRMKLYKEKYAGPAAQKTDTRRSGRPDSRRAGGQNGGYKDRNKRYTKNTGNYSRKPQTAQKQNVKQSAPAKKGFFAKLISIFGGRK